MDRLEYQANINFCHRLEACVLEKVRVFQTGEQCSSTVNCIKGSRMIVNHWKVTHIAGCLQH
jgi:hypothetical protein